MSTHNICLCREERENILAVILLDCALIGVCAVIRSNTVYNADSLKSHFYIVILDLQVCALFFLFLLKNIDCWCWLKQPRQGGSNKYTHNLCFEQKYEKNQNFYLKIFLFFWGKIFSIFE